MKTIYFNDLPKISNFRLLIQLEDFLKLISIINDEASEVKERHSVHYQATKFTQYYSRFE